MSDTVERMAATFAYARRADYWRSRGLRAAPPVREPEPPSLYADVLAAVALTDNDADAALVLQELMEPRPVTGLGAAVSAAELVDEAAVDEVLAGVSFGPPVDVDPVDIAVA